MATKKNTPSEIRTEIAYQEGQTAALRGTIKDEANLISIFCCTFTELLTKIASGEIDVTYLAKRELASRGMNLEGQWVGFRDAKITNGIWK